MSDGAFKSGELTIEVGEREGTMTVAWLGTSDAREPGRELTPWLGELANKAVGKKVEVDFRKLEYMNSGTVSPIIQFARALDGLGVETRLLFDSKIGWQRVNFVSLKAIARTLTRVTVEG